MLFNLNFDHTFNEFIVNYNKYKKPIQTDRFYNEIIEFDQYSKDIYPGTYLCYMLHLHTWVCILLNIAAPEMEDNNILHQEI